MSDRPVNLDMGHTGAAAGGMDAHTQQQPRQEADSQAAEQFRARLAGEAAQSQPQAGPMASPFSLFAAAPPMADPADTRAAEKRMQIVEEAVSRMLVSDTSRGGDAEVRIKLKDDLLPGTEVRVSQREGRLEIDFVANAESGAWLAAQAESIAGELARRLKREVRVAVHRDDDEDTALADRTADGGEGLPAGPASLFGRGEIRDEDAQRGEDLK